MNGSLSKDNNGYPIQVFDPVTIVNASANVAIDCSNYIAFSNSVASDYSFNGGIIKATLQAGSIRGCKGKQTITFSTATVVEFM